MSEKMDLVYAVLPNSVRVDLQKIGAKVEDASDYIHEDRTAVYFPENKTAEYKQTLIRHNLINSSFAFLTNNL